MMQEPFSSPPGTITKPQHRRHKHLSFLDTPMTMQWSKLLSYRRLAEDSVRDYDPARPPWQIDYDRLVFSSAFRRLQDKTQVHPLSSSDYVRTRLTHSLEVSSVARTLGTIAGDHILRKYGHESYGKATLREVLSPSDIGMLTSAAALAHDIGNPPFGHSGEDAIRYWFAISKIAQRVIPLLKPEELLDFEKWEGNAAGFRILSRLQFYRNKGGMKLTTACLGAFMKYPCGPNSLVPKDASKLDVAAKKPGYFLADKPQWEEVANDTGLIRLDSDRWCRHPLAYLTEAADDICYRIIDLEDGFRLGRIPYRDFLELMTELLEPGERNSLDEHPNTSDKVAYLRAKAITKMVAQVSAVFERLEPDILEGKPVGDLISQTDSPDILERLKMRTIADVYRMPTVLQIETAGFEILSGLLDAVVDAAFPPTTKKSHKNAALFAQKVRTLIPGEFLLPECEVQSRAYEQLLLAVDFVAGMTDSFALDLYRKIRGVTIPR